MPHEESTPVIARAVPVLLLLLVAGLLLRGLTPWGKPGDRLAIETVRTADAGSRATKVGATSAERFGAVPIASMGAPADGPKWHWSVPEGWEQLSPTDLRIANLRPAGHANAECYLTILSGIGGGLSANVNRWRAQLGLEAQDDAAIEALPSIELLGTPATLVELEGDYSGMGDTARADWALLGAVQIRDGFTVFVKMTGPAEVLRAERAGFVEFCTSLHTDTNSHTHSETAPEPDTAPATEPAASPESAGGSRAASSGLFAYELPEGWSDAGPRTMRAVNLMAGAKTQCYVVLLAGEGGGLLANVNRWMGEMGKDALTADEVAALPKVSLLGEPSPMLDVSGEFSGMGAEAGPGQTLLGALSIRPSASVFVKMIGPAGEVDAAREGFVAFVESLEEDR